MAEALNIYQKLQKCRVELQKTKMKKSGLNKFSNYEYFELGDFLPRINELMQENGLTALFFFEKEKARIHIIDTDKPEDKIVFASPVAMAQLKGCHDVQNIGATQTYMRRYLYIMAFEIAEHDAIETAEKEEKDDAAETAQKVIDANKVKAIRNLLETSQTDEKQFLDFYHLDALEEMTVEEWLRGMKSLEKKIREQKTKGTTETKENLGI
jgi:DNA-binding transcriptional regulator YiaG